MGGWEGEERMRRAAAAACVERAGRVRCLGRTVWARRWRGLHLGRHHGGDLGEALDARLAHAPDLVAREHLEDGQQPLHRQRLADDRAERADLHRRRLAHTEDGVVGERDDLGHHELAAQVLAHRRRERAEQLRRDDAVLLDLVVVREAQHGRQHRLPDILGLEQPGELDERLSGGVAQLRAARRREVVGRARRAARQQLAQHWHAPQHDHIVRGRRCGAFLEGDAHALPRVQQHLAERHDLLCQRLSHRRLHVAADGVEQRQQLLERLLGTDLLGARRELLDVHQPLHRDARVACGGGRAAGMVRACPRPARTARPHNPPSRAQRLGGWQPRRRSPWADVLQRAERL